MPLQFRLGNDAGNVLYEWWADLENNKGDRAELRRCQEPMKALFVPEYYKLQHKLQPYNGVNSQRLPAIAALSANIRELSTNSDLAAQMAAPRVSGGTTPRLSELRFRRLLQCQTVDDLFTALRRVVYLLDRNVNLYDLADSVYWWGENVRRRWAYSYYGALKM